MKFRITETIHSEKVKTVRLGTAATEAGRYGDEEVLKAVKLDGESRYALCDAGDPIEGFISSVNLGTYDGYSVGGVITTGYKEVTFDGDEATPGTGTLAVGDYVVCGTVTAKGTKLAEPVKVVKATIQPGVTEASAVGDVNDHLKVALHAWRVVSLGSAGTGAVDTTGVIERVNI